jgi:chromosome segregation ATPase
MSDFDYSYDLGEVAKALRQTRGTCDNEPEPLRDPYVRMQAEIETLRARLLDADRATCVATDLYRHEKEEVSALRAEVEALRAREYPRCGECTYALQRSYGWSCGNVQTGVNDIEPSFGCVLGARKVETAHV